jgi:hypothetical protein
MDTVCNNAEFLLISNSLMRNLKTAPKNYRNQHKFLRFLILILNFLPNKILLNVKSR